MPYSVDYKTLRYVVGYITLSGKYIPGEIFFQEKKALEFALQYQKDHPEVQVNVYRIEQAIVTNE